jgi:trehalose-phosphatase
VGGPPEAAAPAAAGPDAAALRAARALGAARPLVLLLDIDGTLAPIAPRPEEARVPDATLAVLGGLAARPHTHLALVTGRAPADGRRMVPVAGAWVVGNHGAERLAPDGAHEVDPAVAAYGAALREAAAELARLAGEVPGAWVEDKTWTLSLHYRQAAPDAAADLVAAARDVAARLGLRAGAGKMVLEIKAPAGVNKGTAGVALARSLGADRAPGGVFAAGDDVTDEDLFRAVRAEVARSVTVRVGAGESAAEWRADGTAELVELLRAVAG